ncbi:MAG: hypothetical protein HRU20_26315 [Pseudomonadales bacterium]|nr:hypothetical protein [Pseudomonadales bacterium]
MIQMHEEANTPLSKIHKDFVMQRGGLKSYLARAERLGVTDCDIQATQQGNRIGVRFQVQGVAHPGYYKLILGPQGRVIAKQSQLPTNGYAETKQAVVINAKSAHA